MTGRRMIQMHSRMCPADCLISKGYKTFSAFSVPLQKRLYKTLKKSIRASQETHLVSATEPNRLMLCGETVAVCCENRTEHTDTLWAVRTSQETHVSAAEPNRLMLCEAKVAVCCESRTEDTYTLCGLSVPHTKHITCPLQSTTS
jgi:hypothetical protein